MRTTLTIEDALLKRLKAAAVEQGISLREFIDRTLRLGLQRSHPTERKTPYRCPTFSMGAAAVPSLDKALALSSNLEDDEILRKLELRK